MPKRNFRRKGSISYSSRQYHAFDDHYANIPAVEFSQLPGDYLPMAEWANKYGVSRQAAHLLFRAGLVRGVKTFKLGKLKVSIYLDKNSEPPSIKKMRRRSLIVQDNLRNRQPVVP